MDPEVMGRLSGPAFADLCQRHRLELVALFGSVATGKARPDSDIDLAVLLDNAALDADEGRSAATALIRDILTFLGTSRVDLVILNRADSLLRFQVARTGRPLYQRERGAFADFCSLALRQHEDSKVFYRAVDKYLDLAARKADRHG